MEQPPVEVVEQAMLRRDGCSDEIIFVVYDSVWDTILACITPSLQRGGICPSRLFPMVTLPQPVTQVRTALAAVAALHNQLLQPALPAAKGKGKGKHGGKSAAAGPSAAPGGPVSQLWARQVSGEGLHMKKWRLILRNLAFQVPTCCALCRNSWPAVSCAMAAKFL